MFSRWALYDKADFSGKLWVLEEGIFPNLCAMGCPHDANIRSLKTISYVSTAFHSSFLMLQAVLFAGFVFLYVVFQLYFICS